MILIADCGSTKINWTLLNGKEKVAQIFTTGMNALLLTEEEMKEQIDELTEEMNQPEFWNDTERSTKVNQKLGHLKNKLAHYEGRQD